MKTIQRDSTINKSSETRLLKLGANALFAATFITFFVSSQALAQERPPKKKPPQEAIDACIDKTEGDLVSFETPRGDTREAVCQTMKELFVAVPVNRKEKDNE